MPEPDVTVIDESFYKIGIGKGEIGWSRITNDLHGGIEGVDYARHKRTAQAVFTALGAGEHPRQHGVTKEDLAAAAKSHRLASTTGVYALWPSMPQMQQYNLVRQHSGKLEHWRIAKMYRLLEADFDQDRPSVRAHLVRNVKMNGELHDIVYTHYTDFRLPGCPTLLIDADVDPVITEAIAPGFTFETIKPPVQSKVIQVHDTACSRRKLTEGGSARRNLAKVAALCTKLANQRKRVLLVSYMPAIEAVGTIEGVETIWFGNLRGVDRYKNHDAIVIAGREQTKPENVENQARALFYADPEPLVLPGHYVEARRPYQTRGDVAQIPARVHVHPDSRVQRLVEQSRECETVQAAARLRLIHREHPAEIYLLSSLPVDLVVDEFTTWGEVLPDRAEAAAQESGGVELLTPSEMARCHPEKWPSKGAAKQFLRRRKGGTESHTYRKGPCTPFLVAYRAEATGTRGPAARALITGYPGKPEAEAALAAVVGPLLTIDYAPDDDEQEASA